VNGHTRELSTGGADCCERLLPSEEAQRAQPIRPKLRGGARFLIAEGSRRGALEHGHALHSGHPGERGGSSKARQTAAHHHYTVGLAGRTRAPSGSIHRLF